MSRKHRHHFEPDPPPPPSPAPAPKAADLPHPLTFFLTGAQREAVLAALGSCRRGRRAEALLLALKLGHLIQEPRE
jgi:hypothetical protein